MVAGFARSSPNPVLMEFAAAETGGAADRRALDIGCGAARNAAPLARQGWHVLGVDRSWPMIAAAAERGRLEDVQDRLQVAQAAMDRLPVRSSRNTKSRTNTPRPARRSAVTASPFVDEPHGRSSEGRGARVVGAERAIRCP